MDMLAQIFQRLVTYVVVGDQNAAQNEQTNIDKSVQRKKSKIRTDVRGYCSKKRNKNHDNKE